MRFEIVSLVFLALLFSSTSIGFLTRTAYAYGLNERKEVIQVPEASELSAVQSNDANIKNSSAKSWHITAVWSLSLTTVTALSFTDLLRLLRDNSDRLDEDLDRTLTRETVHNIKVKIRKRIHRMCKSLNKMCKVILEDMRPNQCALPFSNVYKKKVLAEDACLDTCRDVRA